MSLDPETFHQSLESRHFARVPHGMASGELQAAADAFLAFLALPPAVKRQLHFSARSPRASADGYTDKTTIERKDPKEFFHWSPALMAREPCIELAASEPVVARFFTAAERIFAQVEAVLWDVYSSCLPEYRERIFRDGRLVDGILRFLCYAPRPEHAFCARAHFDKGFSTLALADSAAGLRIGCCNDHPLEPVRHADGSAIFMPAWMLFKASNGTIKPSWHDVVHQPGEQDVSAICARWSMVFFVNDPGTPFSEWDTVHTPLH